MQQTAETELMHARVGEAFAIDFSQADCTVGRRRTVGRLALAVLVVGGARVARIAVVVRRSARRQMALEKVADALFGNGLRRRGHSHDAVVVAAVAAAAIGAVVGCRRTVATATTTATRRRGAANAAAAATHCRKVVRRHQRGDVRIVAVVAVVGRAAAADYERATAACETAGRRNDQHVALAIAHCAA